MNSSQVIVRVFLLLLSLMLILSAPLSAQYHSGDVNQDVQIDLSELLRIIQLYNGASYGCDAASEDGFMPGGADHSCEAHSTDYEDPYWQISLRELLRSIQLYQFEDYHNDCGSEDGFAADSGLHRRCSGDYQCDSWWLHTDDPAMREKPNAVLALPDGGAILLSTLSSEDPTSTVQNSAGVKAYSACGALLWEENYKYDFNVIAHDILATEDDGYVIGAYVYEQERLAADFFLFKIDATGSLIWEQRYAEEKTNFFSKLVQAPDKGYLLLGSSSDFSIPASDTRIVKTDSQGVLQWARNLDGGAFFSEASDAVFTPQEDIMLLSFSADFSAVVVQAVYYKLDAQGNEYYAKTLSGSASILPNAICRSSDDNYLIAGSTNSYGAGGLDGYLVKINEAGEVIWAKTFGGSGSESFRAVRSLDNGRIMVGGVYGKGIDYDAQAWHLELDASGALLWESFYSPYGGVGTDVYFDFTESDRRWASGKNSRQPEGSGKTFLIKFNESGSVF